MEVSDWLRKAIKEEPIHEIIKTFESEKLEVKKTWRGTTCFWKIDNDTKYEFDIDVYFGNENQIIISFDSSFGYKSPDLSKITKKIGHAICSYIKEGTKTRLHYMMNPVPIEIYWEINNGNVESE